MIMAVIYTTFAVAKKKPEKKFRLVRDSFPWPLRYRCTRGQRVRIPYKPEFFSGFLFPAVKVVHITAMIILHLSVFVFVVVLFCLFVCLFVFFLWNRNVLGFHVMKESEPNCKTSHRNFNSLSDETHGKSELTVHKQSRGYKRN